MGVLKKVGTGAKHLVNYRADRWLGYQIIKDHTNQIFKLTNYVFKIKQPKIIETFEESMNRLQLTEYDIQKRIKEFTFLMFAYLMISGLVFTYSLYLAFNGHLANFIITFGATVFTLSSAFHYSFWLFQLKHRKLGCSFSEWLDGSITE